MCLTHSLPYVPHHLRRQPISLPITGIRRSPRATPHGGLQFGHLVEPSSEHTPINDPSRRNSSDTEYNDLTTTVAASENSDGFQQQAAVSQQAPSSVVNPWLSGFMWSSTRKLVRGNESIASVAGSLSKGKRDRDLESA